MLVSYIVLFALFIRHENKYFKFAEISLMKRLLLEDYIEDIGLDKLEDEVEGVTPEELRQAFPYYFTVSVQWERTFDNPNIPLKRIEDNIENTMAMVRLFSMI